VVEPIRRSLEYQAVGRKLLMVDELPQGALIASALLWKRRSKHWVNSGNPVKWQS